MCMGGAILLKERNKDMSALHQLVGIYLFHGDLHKLVNMFKIMTYVCITSA